MHYFAQQSCVVWGEYLDRAAQAVELLARRYDLSDM
jgi:hypothetical protein